MKHSLSGVIYKSLYQLLRPLAKILLTHGVSVQELMEVVKRAYVDVAEKDFQIPGKKQSTSRISVLTGLHRTEVARIRELEDLEPEDEGWMFHNRAARVVSAWNRDEKYMKDGAPADLPLEGKEGSFAALVKAYSGGMPLRSVLDELLRVGTVKKIEGGEYVRLCHDIYIPHQSNEEKLRFMGEATADLLSTIEHNISSSLEDSRLQLTVSYDNLPQEAVAQFKTMSNDQAIELLQRWDGWLSQFDRDANPSVQGTGKVRAGVGIYFFEQADQDED